MMPDNREHHYLFFWRSDRQNDERRDTHNAHSMARTWSKYHFCYEHLCHCHPFSHQHSLVCFFSPKIASSSVQAAETSQIHPNLVPERPQVEQEADACHHDSPTVHCSPVHWALLCVWLRLHDLERLGLKRANT